MTKQEFQRLVDQHGYDHVHKLIVGNRKNIQVLVEGYRVVVRNIKKPKKNKKVKSSLPNVTKQLKLKKKKEKKLKKQDRYDSLKKFAQNLNINEPRSELWFKSLYQKHYALTTDLYNKPFRKRYIPDVINFKFRYIIEIDGSIHNTPEQIKKDIIKDYFYKKHNFKVFRVKAYDNESYIKLIKELFIIRGKYSYPTTEFREYLLTLGQDYSKLF